MKKLAMMQALSVLALAGLAGTGLAVGEPEPRTKPNEKRAHDSERLAAANNKRAKKAAKRARIAARNASANARIEPGRCE